MKMPVWITLKDVPSEYRSSAIDIAESLGPVLGKNRGNSYQNDQKFRVVLIPGEPFPMVVEVVNPVNDKVSHISVDYKNLPIRCRHCLSTSQLVKECLVLLGKDSQANKPTGETWMNGQAESKDGASPMNGQAGSKVGAGPVPNSASRNTTENQVVIVEEQREERISHLNHTHVSGTVEQQRGTNESRHPLVRNATNPEGDSTSSASSDKISQQAKRPNPSFRGIRKEANLTETNRKEKQK
jgi:hypothetical protein